MSSVKLSDLEHFYFLKGIIEIIEKTLLYWIYITATNSHVRKDIDKYVFLVGISISNQDDDHFWVILSVSSRGIFAVPVEVAKGMDSL